jgi:hypothetical protein
MRASSFPAYNITEIPCCVVLVAISDKNVIGLHQGKNATKMIGGKWNIHRAYYEELMSQRIGLPPIMLTGVQFWIGQPSEHCINCCKTH